MGKAPAPSLLIAPCTSEACGTGECDSCPGRGLHGRYLNVCIHACHLGGRDSIGEEPADPLRPAAQALGRPRTYKPAPAPRLRLLREDPEPTLDGDCPRCGYPRGQGLPARRLLAQPARLPPSETAGAIRQRRKREKDRRSGRAAERIEEYREAGLCTKCGKAPSVEGSVRCQPCLDWRRDYYRRRFGCEPSSPGKPGRP